LLIIDFLKITLISAARYTITRDLAVSDEHIGVGDHDHKPTAFPSGAEITGQFEERPSGSAS
jgi:hypothetical protein